MILAICGQKGGAGKTTTTISLAAEWHARGRKVLVVDADPQGSTRTWGDVAVEANVPVPLVVSLGAGLHKQLPELAAPFEITIVDCPPRHSDIQRAALMVADHVIIPCGPGIPDVWAITRTVDVIREAQDFRPGLDASVLVTKVDMRTAIGQGARTTLAETNLRVLSTSLGDRVTYQEAPAAGKGPTTYEPNSAAAKEVRALVDELELILGLRFETITTPTEEAPREATIQSA